MIGSTQQSRLTEKYTRNNEYGKEEGRRSKVEIGTIAGRTRVVINGSGSRSLFDRGNPWLRGKLLFMLAIGSRHRERITMERWCNTWRSSASGKQYHLPCFKGGIKLYACTCTPFSSGTLFLGIAQAFLLTTPGILETKPLLQRVLITV